MQKRQLTQASPPGGLFRALTAAEAAPMRDRERERETRLNWAQFIYAHSLQTHTNHMATDRLSHWLIAWPIDPPALFPPSDSNTLGQADSAIIWGEINVQRVQWHRLMANFSQYIEFALHDSPPHCCCQQQRHVFCQGQGQGHGQERSKGGPVRRGSVAKKAATQLWQMMRCRWNATLALPHVYCPCRRRGAGKTCYNNNIRKCDTYNIAVQIYQKLIAIIDGTRFFTMFSNGNEKTLRFLGDWLSNRMDGMAYL